MVRGLFKILVRLGQWSLGTEFWMADVLKVIVFNGWMLIFRLRVMFLGWSLSKELREVGNRTVQVIPLQANIV
jgi:hypothetical protein